MPQAKIKKYRRCNWASPLKKSKHQASIDNAPARRLFLGGEVERVPENGRRAPLAPVDAAEAVHDAADALYRRSLRKAFRPAPFGTLSGPFRRHQQDRPARCPAPWQVRTGRLRICFRRTGRLTTPPRALFETSRPIYAASLPRGAARTHRPLPSPAHVHPPPYDPSSAKHVPHPPEVAPTPPFADARRQRSTTKRYGSVRSAICPRVVRRRPNHSQDAVASALLKSRRAKGRDRQHCPSISNTFRPPRPPPKRTR